jgi:pimeloyl-ACP methyl ester carboxylesterase
MCRDLLPTREVFLIVLLSTQIAYAQGTDRARSSAANVRTPPLVLSEQGSFFVNEQQIETSSAAAGISPAQAKLFGVSSEMAHHRSGKGMYVQYQVPQTRNRTAYPVIMVHGSGHTGKTYETTPDGRMGWAEYFVRQGVPVYVVDHAGRARSGFDPSPTNRAKLENKADLVPSFQEFTNETAWTAFRFGPSPFIPYPGTKFPLQAKEQYFAQIVPNTETSYAEAGQNTIAALAALLDRIGPAVVIVHSQSGAYGIGASTARPDLAKAIVSVEPRSCAVSDENIKAVFARVKLLTMFGDFFGGNVADWPGRMAECVDTVSRIKAAGGMAENIFLPERGIRGNSHMLMMDTNNQQLADIILAWLSQHARAPAGEQQTRGRPR